jgi:hypothetical protein
VSVVRFRPRPPKFFNENKHLAQTAVGAFFLLGPYVGAM